MPWRAGRSRKPQGQCSFAQAGRWQDEGLSQRSQGLREGRRQSLRYLVGFHPSSGRYLVYGTYYEGSDCKMVSARTGKATSFLDVPHFAPDGQTFFVTGVDGGYDNWLGVGSMTTDPPALQWRNQAEPDVYWHFVRWVDNDQIALSTHRKGETCSDGNCDSVLKRATDGWMLDRVQARSDPK